MKSQSLFTGPIARRALIDAFIKLAPRWLLRNPVMFSVEVVTVLVTGQLIVDIARGTGDVGFEVQIAIWLWLTVLFANFAEAMDRVLPEGRFVKLDNANRIFDAFFTIHDINSIVHPMSGIRPNYYGIYEDNDPSKRLMVVANFDNDVPEYWEWSGQGLFPFDQSNEAYKLGVNYMIYGMTH